ncbi:DUF502 domain-containing protein [Legionella impletisoli]|uniref:DUF502 domain-containing protein n=1 Tax=Legionella impletisoli TaxID=343510 RepID=A0A917JWS6_9GAMM|nr:DUF502 domain-containing protein [Legionella impletisoli]GGI90028.1 hypothetical protein GCM10007966_18520 [Legionella impletisoli]
MKIKGKMSSIFWKGLFTLLPLYLTLYFLFWLLKNIENTFGGTLKLILGNFYFPGMGLIAALILVFTFGILLQIYITRYINDLINRFISNLPVIGEIYDSLRSIIKYLTKPSTPGGEEVVMVEFKENNFKMLGIVTRKDFEHAPKGIGEEGWISVYLPMSYQIGGFTVYVPEKCVTKVNLNSKQALKWALIGGIKDNHS